MSMEPQDVYVIRGDELESLLHYLVDRKPYKVSVCLDEGGVKLKVDEYTWSPPLGRSLMLAKLTSIYAEGQAAAQVIGDEPIKMIDTPERVSAQAADSGGGVMHVVTVLPSGAECSCGKQFNVWRNRQSGYRTANDVARQANLARANARRHAAAANGK